MKAALGATFIVVMTACAVCRGADFTISDRSIGDPIAGFGACMNPYLYAYPNMPREISAEQVKDLEAKVKELHPQFVRIFFLNSWWEKDTDASIAEGHTGMRESFIKTAKLAQDAGASVLIQLWYDPDHYQDMDGVTKRFATAIKALRDKHGLTCIRYATIQNEPDENSDDVKIARYPKVYHAFDRALREAGIRDQIRIIGGDLVGEKWKHWLEMMAREMSDVCDGYSIHSYWDYWRIGTFRQHIAEVKATLDAMPEKQRRPMYVTEFGARGFRAKPGEEPGKSDKGTPLCDEPVYSFEIAIFTIDCLNAGFVGTAQWDLYDAWYDRKMGYGVIGPVETKFALKPGYWLLKMFTHACEPGWHAMKIDGAVEDVWVAALKGKGDEMSTFVLNRVHAEKKVTIGGMKPDQSYRATIWNADRKGTLKLLDPVRADHDGVVTMTLPEMAVEVLTAM